MFTLSGGLSRNWRLPGVLRRLGSWGAGDRQTPTEGGSVSSFLDVKTGCLVEGGVAPRPFSQEVSCSRVVLCMYLLLTLLL